MPKRVNFYRKGSFSDEEKPLAERLTGFLRLGHAYSITEESRRAFDFGCRNPACGCTYHWRKAVHGKENTDFRAETFAKNPSSSHVEGCHFDYERIARENHEYVFLKDGLFHLRVLFPLGGARVDRYPMRGYLTREQIRSAAENSDKKGVSSLHEMTRFIEKNFGSLESPALEDLVLYYQGQSMPWHDVFIPSDEYGRFFHDAAQKDENGNSPPRLIAVRVRHENGVTSKGHPKFVCEVQKDRENGCPSGVRPIVSVDHYESGAVAAMREAAESDRVVLIGSRPFSPVNNYAVKNVYLHVHQASQISGLSDDYWHLENTPKGQKLLFPLDELTN